jgi:hypothetical protein
VPWFLDSEPRSSSEDPQQCLEKCNDCARLEQLLEFEERVRNRQDSPQRTDSLFKQVYLPRILADRESMWKRYLEPRGTIALRDCTARMWL